MMQRVEVEEKAICIQRNSSSMAQATADLRRYSEGLTSQGGYGDLALKRINAMVAETQERRPRGGP